MQDVSTLRQILHAPEFNLSLLKDCLGAQESAGVSNRDWWPAEKKSILDLDYTGSADEDEEDPDDGPTTRGMSCGVVSCSYICRCLHFIIEFGNI